MSDRQIIDSVVMENEHKNPALLADARVHPPYFGEVDNDKETFSLNPIKNKKNLESRLITNRLREAINTWVLKGGDNKVFVIKPGKEPVSYTVSPEFIKVVKSAVSCAVTTCPDYGVVLSEAIHQMLDSGDCLQLPLNIKTSNKAQEVLAKEVNDLLMEIFRVEYHDSSMMGVISGMTTK